MESIFIRFSAYELHSEFYLYYLQSSSGDCIFSTPDLYVFTSMTIGYLCIRFNKTTLEYFSGLRMKPNKHKHTALIHQSVTYII